MTDGSAGLIGPATVVENGEMSEPKAADPHFARNLIVWSTLGALAIAAIIWGGLQRSDPLAAIIGRDWLRHIAGFGVLGLCAALLPSPMLRLAALAGAVAFGLGLEIMQQELSSRRGSKIDVVSSVVGAFAGFGGGAAFIAALHVFKDYASRRLPEDSRLARLLRHPFWPKWT
jgi:VanZ family protein